MSVQIIVDSAADFEAADIERYGLRIVSLKTIFSDGEYIEGQNLTRQGFYQKLEATGEIPKTCQATPFDFEKAYNSAAWMDAMEHPEEHEDPEVLEYGISTFVYERRKPFDVDALSNYVQTWPDSVVRSKGMLWAAQDPDM